MAPKNRRIHTQDLSSPAKLRRQKEEEEVPMVTRDDKVYKQKNKELKIIMNDLKIETLKSELNRMPKGDYTKHAKWHGVLRSKTAAMGRRHGEVEWEKKRAEVMREEMSRWNLVLQFHQLKSVWKDIRNKKYASLIIEEPIDWTAVQCTAWQDDSS